MPKKFPEQTKGRAVRLVLDHLDEYDNLTAACDSVSKKTGGARSRCAGGCARPRSMPASVMA